MLAACLDADWGAGSEHRCRTINAAKNKRRKWENLQLMTEYPKDPNIKHRDQPAAKPYWSL